MVSKRDFDENNSNADADEQPAKKGRLGDDEVCDLVIDLPPNEQHESEVSNRDITSFQTNQGECGDSEVNVDTEYELEKHGNSGDIIEENINNVQVEDKEKSEADISDQHNEIENEEIADHHGAVEHAEISVQSDEVKNVEVVNQRERLENVGIPDDFDEVENVQISAPDVPKSSESIQKINLNYDSSQEVFLSDHSSHHESESVDSFENVDNCDSKVDPVKITDPVQKTGSDSSNCEVTSGDSNQTSLHSIYPRNNIDDAIDCVVARYARLGEVPENLEEVVSVDSRDSIDRVISISSDSEDNDRNTQNPADDVNIRSTNRFIQITPRVQSQGPSLLKTKTVIVGTPIAPNEVDVSPVTRSSQIFRSLAPRVPTSGAITSVGRTDLIIIKPTDQNMPRIMPKLVPSATAVPALFDNSTTSVVRTPLGVGTMTVRRSDPIKSVSENLPLFMPKLVPFKTAVPNQLDVSGSTSSVVRAPPTASTTAISFTDPIVLKTTSQNLPRIMPKLVPTTNAKLDLLDETLPLKAAIGNSSTAIKATSSDVPVNSEETNIGKACIIKTILRKSFSSHFFNEKMKREVFRVGRPCPKLYIPNSTDPNEEHETSEYYYKTVPWLSGSTELSKFFCWPCVLYNSSSRPMWMWDLRTFNRAGFTKSVENHEITNQHLEAAVRMKTQELAFKKNVDSTTTRIKNEKVRKNRYFFKLLIEVVCTVKKKLNNMYTSQVDCIDLINLISTYDHELKDYLELISTSSSDTPASLVSSYVGGVLASVEKEIRSEMNSELERAVFVSLILEDTSEVVDKSWVSVIVRFVNEKGDVCERFIKFVELGYGRTPPDMLPLFQNIVDELKCGDKMVGFTYGGTFIEPPLAATFNSQVTTHYPTAQFFHYKEHNLRSLICQSLSHLLYTRGFLQFISDLSDFFESTPNAVDTFVSIHKDLNSGKHSLDLDFSSGFILTIQDHYASMVKFLMKIIAWPNDWTGDAATQAPYFLNLLRKLQNRFFLVLLGRIFKIVDPLTKAMEENIDVDEWKLLAKRVTVSLFQFKRTSFDEVVELASSSSLTRDTMSSDSSISQEMKTSFYRDKFDEMIDYVATIISARNTGAELSYISLNTIKFLLEDEESDYRQPIIDRILLIMKMSDISRLERQLVFFTTNRFFREKSLSESIRSFSELKMDEFLPDLNKFLQLLATVPWVSADVASLKPKIKRVKTYIRGKEELNSVDALMWIEKEMIDNLQENPQFYDNVINIFARHYGAFGYIAVKNSLIDLTQN
ncbi:hypothetical protein GE061_012368 [Apolygus lucorum]|uniref:Uncharacterized protein n=1 Tax=Apolygus lucorum TaxID=248454 RepID=A0A6A4K1E0_APOLU|nr:hypothetical protein GE061_012368 [Apolygus lucorum]